MENKRVKLRGIQRMVAQRMVKSKTEIPHVTTIREIRMDAVLRLRERLNGENPERKTPLLPFVMMAVVRSIRKYPVFNASLVEDEIVFHDQINLGVAITVGEDLIVPIVKGVQEMSLLELSSAYNELVGRAMSKKLSPHDFEDGTFTISNSGALGGEIFTPIINYPESAILGIGRIQKKPVVEEDGSIAACPMMYLCLSYDHRIINGNQAVRMLGSIDEYLQCPE
jgi:pyruvate dehydrogenase E2 component (dihydrolipoamide acetyltransferase)